VVVAVLSRGICYFSQRWYGWINHSRTAIADYAITIIIALKF